ncbi:MAG: PPA1309 family protein [Mycobacteriales bacterium]
MFGMAEPSSVLETTVVEIELHAARAGWDRPPALFALVDTAELARREPALAAQLGLAGTTIAPGALTPIEQEALDPGPLDEALAQIAWPPEVIGAALVHEVLILPPSAESERPTQADPVSWAAEHPERREVRMAVGVLRDGSRASALRVRATQADPTAIDDVLVGPDLAPNLAEALLETLR